MKLAPSITLAFALCFATADPSLSQDKSGSLKSLVARHASANGVPMPVANAVVILESRYRPQAVNKGNYGLMQIRYGTAQSMGYRGSPAGLLNAETNLQFGMKYLARGWRNSGGDLCRTIAHYQTGRQVRTIPRASLAYCARARAIIARG